MVTRDLRARIEQIGWVSFYLADLESDFSVFHGETDIYSMWGPDVLRKAHRIGAYDGVMSRRVEAARERRDNPQQTAPAAPREASTRQPAHTQRAAAGRLPKGASVVPVSAMAMSHQGLFERHKASGKPATQ